LGSVTSLVNNAGITGRAAGIDALDADSLRRVFDVNVLGTLLCVREAVKQMAPRHGGAGGAVVNLSSVASQTGGAGMLVGYAASKGAVNTLTLGLARELAVDGIRVNAVMPGIVETAIHEQAGVGARMPALLAMVPMQRIGQPEECAEAIAWLLSAAASYTTGAVLPITGGR
jgi:NAD(P)-dependent dehydrogenase (short-subunit alcohol dehydrogenase family)